MKKYWPFISLTIGLIFSFALVAFSPLKPAGQPVLPLLAALYMSELGMLMALLGAWWSGQDAWQGISKTRNAIICTGNLLLAVNLFLIGLKLWPDSF